MVTDIVATLPAAFFTIVAADRVVAVAVPFTFRYAVVAPLIAVTIFLIDDRISEVETVIRTSHLVILCTGYCPDARMFRYHYWTHR